MDRNTSPHIHAVLTTNFDILCCSPQSMVVNMAQLPRHSYFLFVTKKDLTHSRARRDILEGTPLEGSQVSVQHLVTDTTSTLLITLTAITNHTQTLVTTRTSMFQVQYRTGKLSWREPTTSHLMRWRCFTSVDSPPNHIKKLELYHVFIFSSLL